MWMRIFGTQFGCGKHIIALTPAHSITAAFRDAVEN